MENNNSDIISIGDLVQVYLVGKLWGEGKIKNISSQYYGGTLLYPVFQVEKESGELIWVPRISIIYLGE